MHHNVCSNLYQHAQENCHLKCILKEPDHNNRVKLAIK